MMIEIKNISKQYQEQVIFNQFNATIPQGELTCLLGPSGKGKTTLLRILMGIESCDSGEIIGLDNLAKSAVFQEDRLCDGLSIYANILLPHIHKANTITIAEIDQALSTLGLLESKEKLVQELSGGMKRRVALLRALFASYDILFLDEPFKGLDDETKQKTMDYFKEKIQGKTVICITHDEAEVTYLEPHHVLAL